MLTGTMAHLVNSFIIAEKGNSTLINQQLTQSMEGMLTCEMIQILIFFIAHSPKG